MYGVEVFHTLPIFSANWKVRNDRPRAHSRVIQISFTHHEDEPEANLLYARMTKCREEVSKSIGLLVKLAQQFDHNQTKELINLTICPCISNVLGGFCAPARFTTTMSIFMYFFIEVC